MSTWHHACFRYATVDLYDTPERCAATLAAWAMAGHQCDLSFTKDVHVFSFHPSEADINTCLANLEVIPK